MLRNKGRNREPSPVSEKVFMLERIEYIEKENSVMIFRCYGSGSRLELPGRLRGKPVTELADHCFAMEPSQRINRLHLQSVSRSEWEQEAGNGVSAESVKGGGQAVQDREVSSTATQIIKGGREETPDNEDNEAPSPAAQITKEEDNVFAGERQIVSENGKTNADPVTADQAMCADTLEEIWLPEGLISTGSYLFYGCVSLNVLHLPSTLRSLGGGAFVSCNHLKEIWFTAAVEGRTPSCMKDVICDLAYELEAVVADPRGQVCSRLVFPGYYEESIENTPARIIEIHYHGTGYKYRQCFQNGQIDMDRYDKLFYLASVQEFLPTVIKLAADRLLYEPQPGEKERQDYMQFLLEHGRDTADWILRNDQEELLELICADETCTRAILDDFLDLAGKMKKSWAVSVLMDCRRRRFPSQRKKYEF